MKTLFIGDTHLKNSLILPLVDDILAQYHIERIIFMGDYVDLNGQDTNTRLYAKDLIYLLEWKQERQKAGIEVVNLIGNHDMSYYLGSPITSNYLKDQEAFEAIGDFLEDLDLQIAFQLDEYLVSHAGFNRIFDVEPWHFERLSLEYEAELLRFASVVGPMRGGKDFGGSPIWADYREMELIYNKAYPKQIVGHTPQQSIDLSKNNIIGVDTFAVDEEFNFYGNGDLLLYDDLDKTFTVVPTEWKNVRILDKLKTHLKK